jgi:hypothetical protein
MQLCSVADLDPDPGSGLSIPNHLSESLETVFLVKLLKFFYADADRGLGIRDRGSGIFSSGILSSLDPGSGILSSLDPGSGILSSLDPGSGILSSLGPGSGILSSLDPGWKKLDPG